MFAPACAVFFSLCQGVVAVQASIRDVCSALRDTHAAIENFSVAFRKDITIRPLNAPDKLVSLYEMATLVADARGRGRYEAKRSSIDYVAGGKNKIHEEVVVAAFDGKRTKSMVRVGKYSRGTITEARSDIPWEMDPWNFLTHYFGEPIYKQLEQPGANSIGEFKWHGRSVLGFETSAVADPSDPGCQWKYRFLIDTDRNFAVVERAGLVQLASDLNWVVYTRISAYDHTEVAPGIWAPMRIEHESFNPTKEGTRKGLPPPLSWRWDIKVTKWTFNQPLPDSQFDVRFEPTTVVNDRVLGRFYQVAVITDQALADEASAAKDYLVRRPWRRVAVWCALGVFLAATLLLVGFRRRMRGRTF